MNNPLLFGDPSGLWTIGVGGNLAAALLIRGSVTGQFVYDGKNVGLLIAPAVGGGTLTFGGSVLTTLTNAENIFQLRRLGGEAGISASGLPIPIMPGIGFEGIAGSDFYGMNISRNWEAKPWFEGHGELTYSFVIELHGENAEKARQYISDNIQSVLGHLSPEMKQKMIDYLGITGSNIGCMANTLV
jgi:hypothetical protein